MLSSDACICGPQLFNGAVCVFYKDIGVQWDQIRVNRTCKVLHHWEPAGRDAIGWVSGMLAAGARGVPCDGAVLNGVCFLKKRRLDPIVFVVLLDFWGGAD